jgi:hypothetical protein
MQLPEQRPLGNSEPASAIDVEPAGTCLLDQRESKRAGSVVRRKGLDPVSIESDSCPDRKLAHLERKREAISSCVRRRPKGITSIVRPPDHQFFGAPLKTQGPKKPREPEIVVRVEMSDEDLFESESDTESHHLPLGTFPAVEQIQVALALHRKRGDVSTNSRPGGRGPQERYT